MTLKTISIGQKVKVLFADEWLDAIITNTRANSFGVKPDHIKVRIPSKPYGDFQIPLARVWGAS